VIDSKLRDTWNKIMAPVGRGLARTPLSPNVVTLLGVVLQVVVAAYILQGRLVLAGLIAIVAGFSDAFDGALAKAKNMTTTFGAILDSTTDRLTDALYFIPIAWLYGVSPDILEHDRTWVAAVSLGALVSSFLVSYIKAKAESMGLDCKVGLAERGERLIVLVASLILSGLADWVLPAGMVVLLVATAFTFLQRLVYVRAQTLRAV
jgi:CDP-diacylglycerol--glycerol-3-phosphate 3-phosphatidyltransferase